MMEVDCEPNFLESGVADFSDPFVDEIISSLINPDIPKEQMDKNMEILKVVDWPNHPTGNTSFIGSWTTLKDFFNPSTQVVPTNFALAAKKYVFGENGSFQNLLDTMNVDEVYAIISFVKRHLDNYMKFFAQHVQKDYRYVFFQYAEHHGYDIMDFTLKMHKMVLCGISMQAAEAELITGRYTIENVEEVKEFFKLKADLRNCMIKSFINFWPAMMEHVRITTFNRHQSNLLVGDLHCCMNPCFLFSSWSSGMEEWDFDTIQRRFLFLSYCSEGLKEINEFLFTPANSHYAVQSRNLRNVANEICDKYLYPIYCKKLSQQLNIAATTLMTESSMSTWIDNFNSRGYGTCYAELFSFDEAKSELTISIPDWVHSVFDTDIKSKTDKILYELLCSCNATLSSISNVPSFDTDVIKRNFSDICLHGWGIIALNERMRTQLIKVAEQEKRYLQVKINSDEATKKLQTSIDTLKSDMVSYKDKMLGQNNAANQSLRQTIQDNIGPILHRLSQCQPVTEQSIDNFLDMFTVYVILCNKRSMDQNRRKQNSEKKDESTRKRELDSFLERQTKRRKLNREKVVDLVSNISSHKRVFSSCCPQILNKTSDPCNQCAATAAFCCFGDVLCKACTLNFLKLLEWKCLHLPEEFSDLPDPEHISKTVEMWMQYVTEEFSESDCKLIQ